MLNHLKPTLKLLRNRIVRCAAACPLGAQLGHCDFMLRALAARRLSQAHKTLCRRAAGNPAIHAGRSMDRCSDLQVAEKVQFCCDCVLVSF